jgi:hypothetical protein
MSLQLLQQQQQPKTKFISREYYTHLEEYIYKKLLAMSTTTTTTSTTTTTTVGWNHRLVFASKKLQVASSSWQLPS